MQVITYFVEGFSKARSLRTESEITLKCIKPYYMCKYTEAKKKHELEEHFQLFLLREKGSCEDQTTSYLNVKLQCKRDENV